MNNASVNWDEVFAQSRPGLVRYIYGKIHHAQEAEDLAQRVLLKAFRARERYDPAKAAPHTWLYNIARTAVIDYYRTRKDCSSFDALENAENLLPDESGGPELNLLNASTQEALADALARLDEQARDLIILHYYEEAPLTEIARMMDIPYGRIKRLHARALAQLKLLLPEIF